MSIFCLSEEKKQETDMLKVLEGTKLELTCYLAWWRARKCFWSYITKWVFTQEQCEWLFCLFGIRRSQEI